MYGHAPLTTRIALAGLITVSTTGISLAEDSLSALHTDTRDAARDLKQAISRFAEKQPLLKRFSAQFIIQGIDIGCGGLTETSSSVKTCIDSLYEADEITGNNNTEYLDSLRDRWRALEKLPEITTDVTWSTDAYNVGLRSSFESLREKCPPETTSREQDIACLAQQFETTYTFADAIKQTLGKSRIDANPEQRKTINSHLMQVDQECTQDLQEHVIAGTLEEVLSPAERVIEGCLSQIHYTGFGTHKSIEELFAASTGDYPNDNIAIRAIKDIAAAATKLQIKYTP